MLSTKDIKVKFLGITPVWQDETGILTPQQIVALSGLLTYSGKPIETILREAQESGKDLDKKIIAILRKSSLKGHASMATTPAIAFSYEASKFIDSGLTGMVFASAIMASGRRTDTTAEDIISPKTVAAMADASQIYQKVSEANIVFFNNLLGNGVNKDEASKILQYGIYGTGIIQFTVESLVTLKREYEAEADWMPEDIGFLIEAIEKELKNFGVDLLYATRLVAPRNTFPYPNIFKNPGQENFVREIARENGSKDNFKIISANIYPTPGLRRRLEDLKKKIEQNAADAEMAQKNWPKLIEERQSIARDYPLSANVAVFSSVAWRVWGDKKRHRTVPMAVESVYYCASEAARILEKFRVQIENRRLAHEMIDEIDGVFSVPPGVRSQKDLLYGYLDRARESLGAYQSLLKMGIKERDAIFLVPRGLKLNVVQDYDLYNLIAGYYPLRICSTVEEELRRLSIKETVAIKNIMQQKGLDWLAWHIQPKCHCAGFCLENDCCGIVKSLVKGYDEKTHNDFHAGLELKFRQVLDNINRQ